MQNFDVVISGGGLSGCLMALSLADLKKPDGSSLTIAIVEANPIHQDASLTFDDRVLALSHGTASFLQTVGAWETIEKSAQKINTIHISDRGHYGKSRITAKEHSVSALGYVVEMALLGQSLMQCLSSKSTGVETPSNEHNIVWFTPDTIQSIKWQNTSVTVTLASNKILSASLLLGCDGAQSACRTFANIGVKQSDYGQTALIANVATQKLHHNVAYERFTDTGPIAMLPLSNIKPGQSRSALVWTLSPEKAQQMEQLDDESFKQALEIQFGSWLGSITEVGKRDTYPLVLMQAQAQIFHRMALLGNAAHTIHPIAGQGFNLGVRDVQQLSAMIKTALLKHQDIGSFSLLNVYENERIKDHQQVITLTDSLVTLFSNHYFPLIVGRNIGLKILNYVAPIKQRVVNKFMGY